LNKSKIEQKYQIALNDLINFLRNSGFLNDDNVESAFRNIPRHEFVPTSELNRAYYNEPLPIMSPFSASCSSNGKGISVHAAVIMILS